MVDWSAANVPRLGRDSIWLCRRDDDGENVVNTPTRHAARVLLTEWLAAARERGRRVLLGFDFPFGYPAGFAARLGLVGPAMARGLGRDRALMVDDENNRNNRFDVAEALNRRISGGAFPFWGCPQHRTARISQANTIAAMTAMGSPSAALSICISRARSPAGSCLGPGRSGARR